MAGTAVRDQLSAHAFGAFLETLRKARRLRQEDLVSILRSTPYQSKTHVKDVYDYEHGKRVPNSYVRSFLTTILNGNAEIADALLQYGLELEQQRGGLPEDAKELAHLTSEARKHGARVAEEWLRTWEHTKILKEAVQQIPPELFDRAKAILTRLYIEAPDRAKQVLEYGEFLQRRNET